MNPLELMKAKGMIQDFGQRHPMIPKFFKRASLEIKEGTIIEMVVTAPDGEPIKTNFRVQAEDLELLNSLKGISSFKGGES